VRCYVELRLAVRWHARLLPVTGALRWFALLRHGLRWAVLLQHGTLAPWREAHLRGVLPFRRCGQNLLRLANAPPPTR